MAEYFLARLGRGKFGRYFPPGVVFACASGYYLYHCALLEPLKELYGYYDPNGKRDSISPNLRKLIGEVFLEARDKQKLGRELFEADFSQAPSITWFAASTLEPKTLGMTEYRTGAMIGLPYFYNYESYNDVPDEALEIRTVKMFRNPLKKSSKEIPEGSNVDKELASMISGETPDKNRKYQVIRKFDKNSEIGKEYLDTLVLSEDAKRFSIARELFLADSYRVIANNCIIMIGGSCAILAANASVSIFKKSLSPISMRLPYYMLSAFYGIGLCKILLDSTNKRYYIKARDRAKALGENYVKGADEYFSKVKRRRELLLSDPSKDEDY